MVKISIIVPVYNVQDYLKECLDSILHQTLRDIEIICVNDGSTDKSLCIMDKCAELDPRVKILDKKNTGYGASMNQGIACATGEYIGIVEPDDYVELDMYEELYKDAEEFHLDWIKGNFQVFKGSGGMRRSAVVKVFAQDKKILYHKVLNPHDYPELIEQDDFHWKGIYRREFLARNQIAFHETPGAAYQDNGFKYQTICMAERVMYVDKAYYWYRRDNPSASTYNTRGLEMMYGEYQFIKKFMEKNREQTRVFRASYYKKLCMQFQDQLSKLLDREWEEVHLDGIIDLYQRELSLGLEEGYWQNDQAEEWIYYEMKFLRRYPRAYFEQKKIQKEIRTEKYHAWIGRLKNKKVVLVCGGVKARQIINFADMNHMECIEAVCDNDQKKWGEKLYRYSIMSLEQAVEKFPAGYYLIAKAWGTQELQEQLIRLGVRKEEIESISIPLDSFTSLSCVI